MIEKTTATHPRGRIIEWGAGTGATAEFERLYRANVDAVTAYFARRAADPQVVADLTADTFVAAITSFGSFDPRRGTARSWVFGIARRVEQVSRGVFKVNPGSLLTALQRLERAGWLDAEWKQTENSRRARIYSLTRAGKKQLELETADWTRRASAIARLLKAEG